MGDSITIPMELIDGLIWNNGKPYSEAQAYIQFMVWAKKMGGGTHFIGSSMITLKKNEFIMSQRDMAFSLKWNQTLVNRFLKKLVGLNQIRINNESKMTRVSLNIIDATQNPESIMNQKRIKNESVTDSSTGGVINNNNISDNYNITDSNSINNNNIYNNNNIIDNNNKTTNNNTFSDFSEKTNFDSLENSDIRVGSGKKSSKKKPYTNKPKDLDMVIGYFEEKYPNDIHRATHFYEYFESIGWVTGKAKHPIKNWKMAVANWMRSQKRFDKELESPKKVGVAERFRKGGNGEFLMWCTNKSCKNYGNTLFGKDEWAIKKGCVCSYPYTHERPIVIQSNKEEVPSAVPDEDGDELITFEEFKKNQENSISEGSKKSAEGSRTSEGSSEHLSNFFDSLFQS